MDIGRPSGQFDTFFNVLSGLIENITAVDDRRHGIAHLSEFISLDEMIKKTKSACPEGSVEIKCSGSPKGTFALSSQKYKAQLF
jgi:hypothetical protein